MDFSEWRRADDSVIQQLPYKVAEWVAEFGSLTQKLSNYVDSVRLDLLKEGVERATDSESDKLGIDHQELSQIREVILFGPSVPWIYARTIMPATKGQLIVELGQKPLGSILFTSSELRRVSLELVQLTQGHRLYDAALQQTNLEISPDYLWARRSMWVSDTDSAQKLLLLEVFLPDSPLY